MRCPFADWRPITENVTRGGRQKVRGFVPHVQTNDGDLFNFFNTRKPPGEGGSADFQCFKDGRLQQFVDLVDQSWAQGSHQHNGNPYFVSCEFEGATSEPMTPEQIDQGGRLIAWAWANTDPFPLVYNTDPDGQGITPHHVFGGGHTCPGPGPREGQFPDLIAAANRWLTGGNEVLDPNDPIVLDILKKLADLTNEGTHINEVFNDIVPKINDLVGRPAGGGGGAPQGDVPATVHFS